MVKGPIPVREMIREALDALGGRARNVEVGDYVLQHYPRTNIGTIRCQIIRCSVNHPSRVYYGERHPRACDDDRYDFLFQTERGAVERYDPARHGVWAVVRTDHGLSVARTDAMGQREVAVTSRPRVSLGVSSQVPAKRS